MSKKLETAKKILFLRESVYKFKKAPGKLWNRQPTHVLIDDREYYESQIESIKKINVELKNKLKSAEDQWNALDDWYKKDISGRQLQYKISSLKSEIAGNEDALPKYEQALAHTKEMYEGYLRVKGEDAVWDPKKEKPKWINPDPLTPAQEEKKRKKLRNQYPGDGGPAIIEPHQTIPRDETRPVKEYFPSDMKLTVEKDIVKARKELKEKVQQIMNKLKEDKVPNFFNDDVIVDAVMNDEDIENIFALFNFSADIIDEEEPVDPITKLPVWEKSVDPEHVEDKQINEIRKQIKQIKRVKVKPLYNNEKKELIKSWMESPNITPRDVGQDEYVEASEDENYQKYLKQQRELLNKPEPSEGYRKYKKFIDDFEKEFEKKKINVPTQKEWVDKYGILSYYDWLLSDYANAIHTDEADDEYIYNPEEVYDPDNILGEEDLDDEDLDDEKYPKDDFQKARANIFSLAERITGKELTPLQKRNLDTHLKADWYKNEQKEIDSEQESGPSGIKNPHAPPADLKSFPMNKRIYNEVRDLLREEDPEISENNIKYYSELIYQGQIENKMMNMLMYDPEIKNLITTLGRKLNSHLRLAPGPEKGVTSEVSNKELHASMVDEIWAYIKSLNDPEARDINLNSDQERNLDTELKNSWNQRRKSITMGFAQKQQAQNLPENISSPEALGYSAMHRYLIERSFEFMRRVWAKKSEAKNSDKNIKETSYAFIAALGDEDLSNLLDVFDYDFPSSQVEEDASKLDRYLKQDSNESLGKGMQGLLNLVRAIAPFALGDAHKREQQMWDLLYNNSNKKYLGYEGYSKFDKDGIPTEDKDWDRIKQLWQKSYEEQKPLDTRSLENIHSSMLKLIRAAARREETKQEAADNEQQLNDQAGGGVPAPKSPPSKAKPDAVVPSATQIKKDEARRKRMLRTLGNNYTNERISKIRAFIKG